MLGSSGHALGRGDGRSALFRQVGTHKAPDREQGEHGQQNQDGRQQVAQAEQVGVIPGSFAAGAVSGFMVRASSWVYS